MEKEQLLNETLEILQSEVLERLEWKLQRRRYSTGDGKSLIDVKFVLQSINDKKIKGGIIWKNRVLPAQIVPLKESLMREMVRESLDIIIIASSEIGRQAMIKLRENKMSFVDISGNYYFEYPFSAKRNEHRISLFEYGHQAKKIKTTRSEIFSLKSGSVVHTLLSQKKFQIQNMRELAQITGLSLGGQQQICASLKHSGLIEYSRKDPIRVIDPTRMLDAWSEYYMIKIRSKVLRVRFQIGDEKSWKDIVELLSHENMEYCLTGVQAAQRWSDYYLLNIGEILVPMIDIYERFLVRSGMKITRTNREADFVLIQPFNESAFIGMDRSQAIPIAHPVQIYLDLISSDDPRAQEFAQYVREKALGY